MIIVHFDDGSNTKIDVSDVKSFLELKKEIFSFKCKSDLKNSNDVTLITFGEIFSDNDEFLVEENQVFLVKINIDLELNKILSDNRLITLLSDEKNRSLIYKILDNPDLLKQLETYKYQKELDNIKSMNFQLSEKQIKDLLNEHSGNVENVINYILNL